MSTEYVIDGVEKNGDLRVSVRENGEEFYHLAWFRDINNINK